VIDRLGDDGFLKHFFEKLFDILYFTAVGIRTVQRC
jgi:hypothetical protein